MTDEPDAEPETDEETAGHVHGFRVPSLLDVDPDEIPPGVTLDLSEVAFRIA